jgi:hypothetical protein
MKKRTPKTLVLLCGLTVAGAACVVPLEAKAQIVVASADYQPMFYDGCVVFFDDWGRPFIYVDGGVFYIPTTYAYYSSYLSHYRVHRVRYHAWHRTHGMRFHHYRRPGVIHRTPAPSYRGPAVNHRTPAPSHRGPAVNHRTPAPSHRGPAVSHRTPARSNPGRVAGRRSSPSRSR